MYANMHDSMLGFSAMLAFTRGLNRDKLLAAGSHTAERNSRNIAVSLRDIRCSANETPVLQMVSPTMARVPSPRLRWEHAEPSVGS